MNILNYWLKHWKCLIGKANWLTSACQSNCAKLMMQAEIDDFMLKLKTMTRIQRHNTTRFFFPPKHVLINMTHTFRFLNGNIFYIDFNEMWVTIPIIRSILIKSYKILLNTKLIHINKREMTQSGAQCLLCRNEWEFSL